MPSEAVLEWNKATRRCVTGGIHNYINGFVLNTALDNADIPKDTQNLEVRAYPMKDKSTKKVAKIILKVREVR